MWIICSLLDTDLEIIQNNLQLLKCWGILTVWSWAEFQTEASKASSGNQIQVKLYDPKQIAFILYITNTIAFCKPCNEEKTLGKIRFNRSQARGLRIEHRPIGSDRIDARLP